MIPWHVALMHQQSQLKQSQLEQSQLEQMVVLKWPPGQQLSPRRQLSGCFPPRRKGAEAVQRWQSGAGWAPLHRTFSCV